MSFTIFLCVTLKLFFLSFVPLLASNPGDATALMQFHPRQLLLQLQLQRFYKLASFHFKVLLLVNFPRRELSWLMFSFYAHVNMKFCYVVIVLGVQHIRTVQPNVAGH